jgi:hypothetical protein
MSQVVTDGKTSMADSLGERGGGAATSGAGVARKVAHCALPAAGDAMREHRVHDVTRCRYDVGGKAWS